MAEPTKRGGRVLADLEAVDAGDDDLAAARQVLAPDLDLRRVVPRRPRDALAGGGVVVRKPDIDQQHRFPIGQHLLRRNAGGDRRRAAGAARVLVTHPDAAPMQIAHDRVDIGSGIGAEVEVIGVLVHVEGEDRSRACQHMGVVGGPLVDQPAGARRPGEDHPAGAAGLRFRHRGERTQPALDRAEVADESLGQRAGREALSAAAEAVEMDLVQDHRVLRDQRLAAEAVDDEAGLGCEIQAR